MESTSRLSSELTEVMNSFVQFREYHVEVRKTKQELMNALRKLKEEVKFLQSTERTGRLKLSESRNLVSQQQDTISKLLVIKDENEKLKKCNSDLQKNVTKLKAKVMKEGSTWEQRLRDIKRDHEKRVNTIKRKLQEEADRYKKDLEFTQIELQMVETESAKKVEELENSRLIEQNDTVQEYEQKVLKLEMELEQLRSESQTIIDRASTNIALYKKKVLELEQQVEHLNDQLSRCPTPTRRPSFQFHKPTNMPEYSGHQTGLLTEPLPVEGDAMAKKQPLQGNTNRKRVMFPAVKKRKLFVQTESGDL